MIVRNNGKLYEVVWKGKGLDSPAVVHIYEESQFYYKFFGMIKKQRKPVWVSYGLADVDRHTVSLVSKFLPQEMQSWLLITLDEYIRHTGAWNKYNSNETINTY
jgi:hypothetical protein